MINITLSLDENNVDGLLTVIKSIETNTTKFDDIFFYILIYDNIDEIKRKIETVFPKIHMQIIEFYKYTEHVNFLNENMYVNNDLGKFEYIKNIMNFARFYIPQIFDIDLCIYLDTDLVVNTDIFNIFNDSNLPAKISDLIIASPMNRPLDCMKFDSKLNMKGDGFNTGVYILNVKYWRDNNFTKKCEEIMIDHKKNNLFNLGTQPIINLLYYNKCTNINKKWNITGLGTNEIDINKLNAGYILHWSGSKKPWLENGLNKEMWKKYNNLL